MTELKTLKDLDQNCDNYGCGGNTPIEPLRQEAIKWVKHFEKNLNYESFGFFIKFFNITEEELK